MIKPLTILAIVALLGSCSNAKKEYSTKNGAVNNFRVVENSFVNGTITIVEIDSCQYIQTYRGGICHKGNCKNPIHWKVITR